jgi:hypothetical protein
VLFSCELIISMQFLNLHNSILHLEVGGASAGGSDAGGSGTGGSSTGGSSTGGSSDTSDTGGSGAGGAGAGGSSAGGSGAGGSGDTPVLDLFWQLSHNANDCVLDAALCILSRDCSDNFGGLFIFCLFDFK